MKTIREHLNDLPEPYRTEALENAKGRDFSKADTLCLDAEDAVMLAFNWSKSSQGEEYWYNLCNTL